MIKEEKLEEFKIWLKQKRGTESGDRKNSNSRRYALPTIEIRLAALGMPYLDLHKAWETDKFETLLKRLEQMLEDERAGGHDYELLIPGSEGPNKRLSSWKKWLGEYRDFLTDTKDPQERGPTSIEMTKEMPSMNIILYGPPGTGKTFEAVPEAVRLCGEPVPKDRAKLTDTYQQLVKAGRIEFVTFHQSMSYEDFVEGRQPMTGSDENEETASAGFRLETVPGIFRRIAERAESSQGPSSGSDAITVADRQVFKMSIGQVNVAEDAQFFQEAIKDGCALFNGGNIDWSDDRYADDSEFVKTWKKEGHDCQESVFGDFPEAFHFMTSPRVQLTSECLALFGRLPS